MRRPGGPGAADDIEERDPGLARERTELAWTRTAISYLALGAILMRTAALAGGIVLATGIAVWALGRLAAVAGRPGGGRSGGGRPGVGWLGGGRPPPSRRAVALLFTVITTLTSTVALVIAVLTPHR